MGVNGIYGLSGSGIDIESMVKVGMLTKQKQYDKMQQTYTKNEWTKQAYNDIYNKLTTYSASTLSPYKLSSNMSAKSAVSTNENAVTATANGNAVVMNHKVNVEKVSANAYLVANAAPQSIIDPNHAADNELALQNYLFKKGSYNATENTLIVSDRNGNVISDVDSEKTVGVKDIAFELTVDDGKNTKTLKYTYGELLGLTQKSNGTIKQNEGSEKTFNDFVSDFNALGTNIRANYDTITGRFSFYNKEGGEANQIKFTMSSDDTVSNNTAAFFQSMKLAQSLDGSLYGTEKTDFDETSNYIGSGGSSAVIKSDSAVMNGTEIATSSTALTDISTMPQNLKFSVNGTEIELNDTMTVGDMVDAINAQSDTTNVQATFGTNGILSLTNTVKGIDSNVTIAADSADAKSFLSAFNLYGSDVDGANLPDTITANGKISSSQMGTSAELASSEAVTVGTDTATAATLISDVSAMAESFSINGTKITLNDTMTVGDMVDAINAQSDTTNVQASFSDDGILTLTSTLQGSASEINIVADNDDAKSFLMAFNLYGSDVDAANLPDTITATGESVPFSFGVTGENGLVTIDGVKYGEDGSITNNSVTAFGVTYKLHNPTTDTVNISIEQDVDAIVDKVKSFIEDYNKLLGGLYDKYEEKQYKDYTPLTASQRESMKDDQIEKWEEKAKSGLLYHDQTISKITTKMRSAISTPIDGLNGKYNSAYSLGISTTGIHGQLTLDEDKLRAALADDSEAVYKVFSTLSKDDDFDQNGVAQRLGDVMIEATKLIKDRAGTDDSTNDDSDLGTLMRNLQNKMSDFKKLLDAFEDRLYKKYDAMEVALSSLGMQLSFITGGQ